VLTQEDLREILRYEPDTGDFHWRVRGSGRRMNKPAGRIEKDKGYRQIGIKYKLYKAHRLAWLYVHGYFPENDIHHVNHI